MISSVCLAWVKTLGEQSDEAITSFRMRSTPIGGRAGPDRVGRAARLTLRRSAGAHACAPSDGPTRRQRLQPLLSELGAGTISGFTGDGAGSVEVDSGAVGASVLSQSNGELAPGAVGCKDEGKFQVADGVGRVGAGR